jgi:exportin-7
MHGLKLSCFQSRYTQDALEIALKMALSIPLTDILAYRKVAKAYYGLLDVLCHNHTNVIATCDAPTFAFLVTSLDAGLKSLDVAISSQCAAAVDNLVGFYFKAMNTGEPPSPVAQVRFCNHFQMCL